MPSLVIVPAAVAIELDIGERALPLSVSCAGVAAGGLPAPPRGTGVLAEWSRRLDRAGETPHSLLANVVVTGILWSCGHEHASFKSCHDIVARYFRSANASPAAE
jgi:hypothetical protein